jgi:hypothetical protein
VPAVSRGTGTNYLQGKKYFAFYTWLSYLVALQDAVSAVGVTGHRNCSLASRGCAERQCAGKRFEVIKKGRESHGILKK